MSSSCYRRGRSGLRVHFQPCAYQRGVTLLVLLSLACVVTPVPLPFRADGLTPSSSTLTVTEGDGLGVSCDFDWAAFPTDYCAAPDTSITLDLSIDGPAMLDNMQGASGTRGSSLTLLTPFSTPSSPGTLSPFMIVFPENALADGASVTLSITVVVVAPGNPPVGCVNNPPTIDSSGYCAGTGGDVNCNVPLVDNDPADVHVTASPTNIPEGTQESISLSLGGSPTPGVTVTLDIAVNTTRVTLTPSQLLFDGADYDQLKTVTLDVPQDNYADPPVSFDITILSSAPSGPYDSLPPFKSTGWTISDDDIADIAITETPTVIPEGDFATTTVSITSAPRGSDTVTVTITPSAPPSRVTISPAVLTFTAADYDEPQVVTIAVPDDLTDREPLDFYLNYTVGSPSEPYKSMGTIVGGMWTADDDDTADYYVETGWLHDLTESPLGSNPTTTFAFGLLTDPIGAVSVSFDVAPHAQDHCVVLPSSATLNDAMPVNVSIAALYVPSQDGDISCDISFDITTAASPDFELVPVPPPISVTIFDIDVAGVDFGPWVQDQSLDEGSSDFGTVFLTAMPTAPVTLFFTSSDASEGTLSPASLVITDTNWTDTFTLTFDAAIDSVVDGTQAVQVAVTVASDPATPYGDGSVVVPNLSFTVTDADIPDVLATLDDNEITEGGTRYITVALGARPLESVVVPYTANASRLTLDPPASLSFAPATWDTPRTVTVTAADNLVSQPTESVVITLGPASSISLPYDNVAVSGSPFLVTVYDDDMPFVHVQPISGAWSDLTALDEGTVFPASVTLGTQPTAPVTVSFSVSEPSQIAVSPATVVIGPGNWSSPVPINITAIQEPDFDLDVTVSFDVDAVSSLDPFYDGVAYTADLPHSFEVIDDEVLNSVVLMYPLQNGIRQSDIRVFFDSPVLPAHQASMAAAISLHNSTGDPVARDNATSGFSADGTSYTLTPLVELTELDDYTIVVDASIAESMIEALGMSESQTFYVIRLISFVIPGNLETDVALNQQIVIFFDQRMNTTATQNAVTVTRADAPDPTDPAAHLSQLPDRGFQWESDGDIVLSFRADQPFDDSITYRITLLPEVETLELPTSPTLLLSTTVTMEFTTVRVPPTVVSVNPASTATAVPIDTTISITFDEPIDHATAANALALLVDTNADQVADTRVPGSITWDADTLIFTPSANLLDDALHVITVSEALTDIPGNSLAVPLNSTFTTADLTIPTVATSSPEHAAGSIEITAPFVVTFSEPMDPATLPTLTQLVFGATTTETVLPTPTLTSVTNGGRTFTFDHDPLDPIAKYRFELSPASQPMLDLSGNPLAPWSIEFRTQCSDITYDDAGFCLCTIGFYGPPNGPCLECPLNGVCEGGFAAPYAQAGFAPLPDNALVFQACTPPEACLANSTCAPGYEGEACADCSKSPQYYRLSSRCVKCPENAWMRWSAFSAAIVVFSVLLLVSLAYFSRNMVRNGLKKYRKSWASRMAALTIGLNFWQIIAVLSSFQLRWPSMVLDLFSVFSVLNFNLDILASDCSVEWSYSFKWAITMGSPLALIFVYLLLTLASRVIAHAFGKRGLPWSLVFTSIVALASFAYMFLAAKTVEFFDCTRQDDGSYILDADPSLKCYEDWWMTLLPAGIAGIVVYVIGIPLMLSVLMFKFRASLEDTTSIGFKVFGVISSRFRPDLSWYELIIMLRKLAILLAMLLFSNSPPIQAMIAQLALLMALAIHQRYVPYTHRELNYVESALLVTGLVVLLFGQVFYTQQSDILAIITVVIVIACSLSVFAVVFYAFLVKSHPQTSNKVVPEDHTHESPIFAEPVAAIQLTNCDPDSTSSFDSTDDSQEIVSEAVTISPAQSMELQPTQKPVRAKRRRVRTAKPRSAPRLDTLNQSHPPRTQANLRPTTTTPHHHGLGQGVGQGVGQGEADQSSSSSSSFETCSVSVRSVVV